jgi:hypothetical protein
MVFGFILAIIVRIVLNDEFINSLFPRNTPFTGQELNDLNIAITTGFLFVTCTAWFFSSVFFYRKSARQYVQQVDDFFMEMHTPINMEKEHVGEHESDSRQYNVLGKLCLIYGGFVMLLTLIPNTWDSRLYISFCGLLILAVGIMLHTKGARIKNKLVLSKQI